MARIIIILFLLILAQPISLLASANIPTFKNNTLKKTDNTPTEILLKPPANGEGLFKVGLITFGVGAATTLVGSVIRWSSQDADVKKNAGYIQLSGLCLMGIPLGISISNNNGRGQVNSTRRSGNKRRW